MTQHIAGDTINVASRLCTLAKAGETLVGQTTYTQAGGFFSFEPLAPVQVKGKLKPIQVYGFCPRRNCQKRRTGFRSAGGINRAPRGNGHTGEGGRPASEGSGSFIAICGEAGTGKSRLIEEFKDSLDLKKINWIEGHAYNYTQNFSYYPLIDLINRELGIEESDTPEKVAEKLETRVKELGSERRRGAVYRESPFSQLS